MKNNLFIPKKIKVGFQNRSDTYTGKLGYVIYEDEKGVWRKESSWNSWRDKNIQEVEFDNKPVNGFVLNKGLQRVSYHWGSGRSVIRVYDSRDFEFEVSVDNLLGILTHSDVSKREIAEEMVFAWAGTELVLLPINSEAYQESLKFTANQGKKISTKDLKPGFRYTNKKSGKEYIYIGFYNWWDWDYGYGSDRKHLNKGKKHIFANYIEWQKKWEYSCPGVNTLMEVDSNEPVDNYAELASGFFETINSNKVVDIRFEKYDIQLKETGYSYHKIFRFVEDDPTSVYYTHYADTTKNLIDFGETIKFELANSIKITTFRKSNPNYYYQYNKPYYTEAVVDKKTYSYRIFLILENGKEVEWKP